VQTVTANSKQQTANSKQQTANSKQQKSVEKAYSTLGSRVVPHHSTDKAQTRLTSEF
jgi:ribosomal protein L20A (L18A)